MLIPLLALFFGIASLALVTSILLTLNAFEHQRYARGSFKEELNGPGSGHVAVIVPCKGVEFSLADNLRRLLVQDYEDYEVHFVVESADDCACSIIQKLIASCKDNTSSDQEKAIALYNKVRDDWKYDPYSISLSKENVPRYVISIFSH